METPQNNTPETKKPDQKAEVKEADGGAGAARFAQRALDNAALVRKNQSAEETERRGALSEIENQMDRAISETTAEKKSPEQVLAMPKPELAAFAALHVPEFGALKVTPFVSKAQVKDGLVTFTAHNPDDTSGLLSADNRLATIQVDKDGEVKVTSDPNMQKWYAEKSTVKAEVNKADKATEVALMTDAQRAEFAAIHLPELKVLPNLKIDASDAKMNGTSLVLSVREAGSKDLLATIAIAKDGTVKVLRDEIKDILADKHYDQATGPLKDGKRLDQAFLVSLKESIKRNAGLPEDFDAAKFLRVGATRGPETIGKYAVQFEFSVKMKISGGQDNTDTMVLGQILKNEKGEYAVGKNNNRWEAQMKFLKDRKEDLIPVGQ